MCLRCMLAYINENITMRGHKEDATALIVCKMTLRFVVLYFSVKNTVLKI